MYSTVMGLMVKRLKWDESATPNIPYVWRDESDNILDDEGYKSNLVDGEVSIGRNGHTGLAKVSNLDMTIGSDSTPDFFDTKTKVKSIGLGVTTVDATNITDLYNEGDQNEYNILAVEKGTTDNVKKISNVKANGPVGGTIHIYDVVEV